MKAMRTASGRADPAQTAVWLIDMWAAPETARTRHSTTKATDSNPSCPFLAENDVVVKSGKRTWLGATLYNAPFSHALISDLRPRTRVPSADTSHPVSLLCLTRPARNARLCLADNPAWPAVPAPVVAGMHGTAHSGQTPSSTRLSLRGGLSRVLLGSYLSTSIALHSGTAHSEQPSHGVTEDETLALHRWPDIERTWSTSPSARQP